MKKLLILLALLAFTANAFATLNCSTTATTGTEILEITDSTNAHGAIPDTGYPVKIYCTDSDSTITLSNNGTNSPSTIALHLNDNTNAHAEIPDGLIANYSTNIYIGANGAASIACESATACQSDETCLVELSDNTNAHLAQCGTGYPVKICCKTISQEPPPTGTCGNGTIDSGEDCEPTIPITTTCNQINPNYTSGNPTCNATCKFDLSNCRPIITPCGNNLIDTGENCNNCPQDIKAALGPDACIVTPPDVCGDGILGTSENCYNCPADAETVNGIGYCQNFPGCTAIQANPNPAPYWSNTTLNATYKFLNTANSITATNCPNPANQTFTSTTATATCGPYQDVKSYAIESTLTNGMEQATCANLNLTVNWPECTVPCTLQDGSGHLVYSNSQQYYCAGNETWLSYPGSFDGTQLCNSGAGTCTAEGICTMGKTAIASVKATTTNTQEKQTTVTIAILNPDTTKTVTIQINGPILDKTPIATSTATQASTTTISFNPITTESLAAGNYYVIATLETGTNCDSGCQKTGFLTVLPPSPSTARVPEINPLLVLAIAAITTIILRKSEKP